MRIKFLTNSALQSKFLIIIVISMLVPLVLIGGCLYYLIFTLMAEQLGIPESIAINLFPVIQKINFILIAGLPPTVIFLLLWGLFLSHKFIGPLERLEKELNRIAACSDCAKRIGVRKSDVIRPIVDAINKLLESMEKKS